MRSYLHILNWQRQLLHLLHRNVTFSRYNLDFGSQLIHLFFEKTSFCFTLTDDISKPVSRSSHFSPSLSLHASSSSKVLRSKYRSIQHTPLVSSLKCKLCRVWRYHEWQQQPNICGFLEPFLKRQFSSLLRSRTISSEIFFANIVFVLTSPATIFFQPVFATCVSWLDQTDKTASLPSIFAK